MQLIECFQRSTYATCIKLYVLNNIIASPEHICEPTLNLIIINTSVDAAGAAGSAGAAGRGDLCPVEWACRDQKREYGCATQKYFRYIYTVSILIDVWSNAGAARYFVRCVHASTCTPY